MGSFAALPGPRIPEASKLMFAAALLRLDNAGSAANEVFADMPPGDRMWCSAKLPRDPIVLAEIVRLKEELGALAFLPDKATTARLIMDTAKECAARKDIEGFKGLVKVYADVMGFIDKPGANVTVAVAVSNVMQVVDHGDDEAWEKKTASQQRNLTLDGK